MKLLEELALRYRFRKELAHHRRMVRAALRREDAGRCRAWWLARMPRERRNRLRAECLEAFGFDARGRHWMRAPGVMPTLFVTAALVLLFLGPSAVLVRASLLKRLPVPAGSHWISMGAAPWTQFLLLRRPDTAAYRYDYAVWEGPRGNVPITVVHVSKGFTRMLGISAFDADDALVGSGINQRGLVIDEEPIKKTATLPARLSILFPKARVWLPMDDQVTDGAYVNVIGLSQLPGWVGTPWAPEVLEDLTYVRWGMGAVLCVWLLLALTDLTQLVRSFGWSYFLRGVGYWAYALTTVGAAGLLLLTLSAYMVRIWPSIGPMAMAVSPLLYAQLCTGALRWCMYDQRYRCRTCLRRLRMPVTEGHLGGLLLATPKTEYVCHRGHGKLTVPQGGSWSHTAEKWTYARDWWKELVNAGSN